MTFLALIRHGPTDWNAKKRLQGRTDRPLSRQGRDVVQSWTLPAVLDGFDWIASPLTRAVETARILGNPVISTDVRLVEMSYGDWEGRRLGELRESLGQQMAENEARGLEFQPPRGESPQMVIERLQGFWCDLGKSGRSTVAVCHNGVIRATYAAAVGWDMKTKPPIKLKNGHVHLFKITDTGNISASELNIPLSGTVL